MTLKLVLLYKELLEASVAQPRQSRAPHAAAPPTTAANATHPAREAPPLHGEDGLANESLPAPPTGSGKPPLV
jgi:hypothetical protein